MPASTTRTTCESVDAGLTAKIVETIEGSCSFSLFGTRLGIDCETPLRRAIQLGQTTEMLGESASCWCKIAEIHKRRGQTDEALHIYRQECMPVFERLGDEYSIVATMGQIAGILLERGEIDETLRIRSEVLLPFYKRLGDAWSKAVTMGQIADIHQQRGDINVAIRTYREILPILEQHGDLNSQVTFRLLLGEALLKEGYKEDIPLAVEHLRWALATAEKHQYAEAAQIRQVVQQLSGRG